MRGEGGALNAGIAVAYPLQAFSRGIAHGLVRRSTRSCVALPEPERIETEQAYQPFARCLVSGDIRYLPTVMLSS